MLFRSADGVVRCFGIVVPAFREGCAGTDDVECGGCRSGDNPDSAFCEGQERVEGECLCPTSARLVIENSV